jgi:hypothetical protein
MFTSINVVIQKSRTKRFRWKECMGQLCQAHPLKPPLAENIHFQKKKKSLIVTTSQFRKEPA